VTAPKIPQYHELMWPALQATKDLGGSATVSEMNERAMASACITEEQQAVPGVVRDFRGAMAGRGEKGLLITTGSFTREAQAEATRDGAPPVELMDGDRLCDLLKEFRLGVEVRERIEQDVTVNPGFFDEYQ
jgi:restriction endonuclease Mrr